MHIQRFGLASSSLARHFTRDRTEHEYEPCVAGALPDVLGFLNRLRRVRRRFLRSHLAQVSLVAIFGRGRGILAPVRIPKRRFYQAILRGPAHYYFVRDIYRSVFGPRGD